MQMDGPRKRREAPDPSLYRLSLYHCLLGDLIRGGAPKRITSRGIADMLDIKEETVRRDISFVGEIGRPGSGYVPKKLYDALTDYLGLEGEYPIVLVGSMPVFQSAIVLVPLEKHGLNIKALFSERPEDVGIEVDGQTVRPLSDIPDVVPTTGARVGVVATSQERAQAAIDQLASAGITGILLMTSMVTVRRPKGVRITQIRIPCDVKSLACRCRPAPLDDEDEDEDDL